MSTKCVKEQHDYYDDYIKLMSIKCAREQHDYYDEYKKFIRL